MKQLEISVPIDEHFEENIDLLSSELDLKIDTFLLSEEIYKSNESFGTYGKAFLFYKTDENAAPFVLIDCFMDEEATLDIVTLVVRLEAEKHENVQEILEKWREKAWFPHGVDFKESLFDTLGRDDSVLVKIKEIREIEKIKNN